MLISNWSSDVCSSDLVVRRDALLEQQEELARDLEEAAAQRRVHALVRQRAPAVADAVVVPHRQRRHPSHHPGHLRLAVEPAVAARLAERRGGKECARTCRLRECPTSHKKKKNK